MLVCFIGRERNRAGCAAKWPATETVVRDRRIVREKNDVFADGQIRGGKSLRGFSSISDGDRLAVDPDIRVAERGDHGETVFASFCLLRRAAAAARVVRECGFESRDDLSGHEGWMR